MGTKYSTLFASCPECGDDIAFDRKPRLEDEVLCASCGTRLVIVALDPVELDWALEEDGEDLYDDDQDLYDDDDDLYGDEAFDDFEDEDDSSY